MSDQDDVLQTSKHHGLRTKIAKVLRDNINYTGPDDYYGDLADAVIAALPELRRIEQVRAVCVESLNVDARRGDSKGDRAWLAGTVLNVLNGEVDE